MSSLYCTTLSFRSSISISIGQVPSLASLSLKYDFSFCNIRKFSQLSLQPVNETVALLSSNDLAVPSISVNF